MTPAATAGAGVRAGRGGVGRGARGGDGASGGVAAAVGVAPDVAVADLHAGRRADAARVVDGRGAVVGVVARVVDAARHLLDEGRVAADARHVEPGAVANLAAARRVLRDAVLSARWDVVVVRLRRGQADDERDHGRRRLGGKKHDEPGGVWGGDQAMEAPVDRFSRARVWGGMDSKLTRGASSEGLIVLAMKRYNGVGDATGI
jgi:hypothetical protein